MKFSIILVPQVLDGMDEPYDNIIEQIHYLCPHEILKEQYFDVWHKMLEESGRKDLQMAHNEFVYVGESDAKVKADVEEHAMCYIRTAAKIRGKRDHSKVAEQFANYTDILEYFEVVEFKEVYDKLGMFWTPDAVAESGSRARASHYF